MTQKKDPILNVDDNPNAPISVRRALEQMDKEGTVKDWNVWVDGTGQGFDLDKANVVSIMIKDRIMQTDYWVDEVLPQLERLPAFLFRYMHWFMLEEGSDMKYPTDMSYYHGLHTGTLKKTEGEYMKVYDLCKYAKSNLEAAHAMALIIMIAGFLGKAKRLNTGIRLFIELPETGFHPKRQARLVTLLNKLKDEYGVKPTEDGTGTGQHADTPPAGT